ncbi:MAG: hypothetical protein GY711_27035 [bacterium]|nr:hypothetical protein [bacterium]
MSLQPERAESSTRGATLCALALCVMCACHESGGGGGSAAATPAATTTRLGDPIEGLTGMERAAFERGRVQFEKRFRPSEGLGPFYNATACASCHSTPVTGGSAQLYRNFYLAVWTDNFTQLSDVTLPGIQHTIPPWLSPVVPSYGSGQSHTLAHFTLEGGRAVIPPDYIGFPMTVAQRNSIPIFGVGLFEFVSDVTIASNADPDDADGDGISGRFNTDAGAMGRFGVKAQSNNVELFTRAPLQNQMGITSNPFLGSSGTVSMGRPAPFQASTDPNAPTFDNDGVPDPEIEHGDLGDLIAFARFLAPPSKKPFDDSARRGEALFESMGCALCHIPSLPSSRGPVDAYTDLLLHEMGSDLADGLHFGVPQPSELSPRHAGGEFRTQPLWGVSLHAPFLHDGRAETLEEAVLLHGGEATLSRDAFGALAQPDREDVIHFLEHL